MDRLLLFYFSFASLFFCTRTYEEELNFCDRDGAFQLSLIGRKVDSDKWNTSYDLKRSSCESTKNWDLVMSQNITHDGKLQKVHLQGHFTVLSGGPSNESLKLKSPVLDRLQVHPSDDTKSSGNLCKGQNLTEEIKLKIVSRSEWGARKPMKGVLALDHPTLSVHFYQKNESCSTPEECILAVRKIQEKEMPSRGDIFANFISGGDDRIYEGIGWDRSMDNELNFKYLTVGSSPPSPQQLASFALLVRRGIETGKISATHRSTGKMADMTIKWIVWAKGL